MCLILQELIKNSNFRSNYMVEILEIGDIFAKREEQK